MQDTEGKRVLAYLREIIELCRIQHRQDLVDDYTDAWELATAKIYGALPPRKPNKGYNYPAPEKPLTTPIWKQQMLAKPFRRIVGRYSLTEDGLTTDYEQLACGHRIMATVQVPHEPQAQRRRCSECAREAESLKKRPAAASAPRKNEVSA